MPSYYAQVRQTSNARLSLSSCLVKNASATFYHSVSCNYYDLQPEKGDFSICALLLHQKFWKFCSSSMFVVRWKT